MSIYSGRSFSSYPRFGMNSTKSSKSDLTIDDWARYRVQNLDSAEVSQMSGFTDKGKAALMKAAREKGTNPVTVEEVRIWDETGKYFSQSPYRTHEDEFLARTQQPPASPSHLGNVSTASSPLSPPPPLPSPSMSTPAIFRPPTPECLKPEKAKSHLLAFRYIRENPGCSTDSNELQSIDGRFFPVSQRIHALKAKLKNQKTGLTVENRGGGYFIADE